MSASRWEYLAQTLASVVAVPTAQGVIIMILTVRAIAKRSRNWLEDHSIFDLNSTL